MNAFEIMAEAKIRQWEKDKQEGDLKPFSDSRRISVRSEDSLEKRLFADIKRLIQRSHLEEPMIRDATLMEAEKLQVQLSVRLERNGCYHLSKYLFDEIRRLQDNAAA